jgi:hypothetical protein
MLVWRGYLREPATGSAARQSDTLSFFLIMPI